MNARFPSGPSWFLLLALFAFTSSVAAAQAFSITAANVTMPPSGSANSQYTINNIPVAGTILIGCVHTSPISPGVKAPVCYTGLPHATPVVAGQTLTGAIQFMPFAVPLPGILLIPITLLTAVTLRRHPPRKLATLAIVSLVAANALGACGGNSSGLTPGNYQFTVSASNNPAAGEGPSYTTQTTVTVKVP